MFSPAHREIIERFANLLGASAKVPSLYRFVYVAIYVSFDGANYRGNIRSFFVG